MAGVDVHAGILVVKRDAVFLLCCRDARVSCTDDALSRGESGHSGLRRWYLRKVWTQYITASAQMFIDFHRSIPWQYSEGFDVSMTPVLFRLPLKVSTRSLLC